MRGSFHSPGDPRIFDGREGCGVSSHHHSLRIDMSRYRAVLSATGVVIVTGPFPTWVRRVKCFWASHGRIIIFSAVIHSSRLEEGKDKFIGHFSDSSSGGTWDSYKGTRNSQVHSGALVGSS